MWYLADYIIVGIWMFFVTWMIYVGHMKLKDLETKWKYLFTPISLVGYVLDIVFNIVYATVIFLQLPDNSPNLTFSHRLRKNIREESGWRYRLSVYFCENFLEPYDHDHCGRK